MLQMTSLFVMQGETMDTALGSLHVAAATVNVLDSISVLFWVVGDLKIRRTERSGTLQWQLRCTATSFQQKLACTIT